jgi:hypothetical protein
MLFMEILPIYCENHMKHTITLCEQNAEILNIETGDTYSYRCALNSKTTEGICILANYTTVV